MLVELKNGETLNGHLVTCDTWMNLTLKEVVQTSPVCPPHPQAFKPGHSRCYKSSWRIELVLILVVSCRTEKNSLDYQRCT